MGDTRLNQLGALLENKNRTIRQEAAATFANFSLTDGKVVEILFKYLISPSWDCRVAAGDALYAILKNADEVETNVSNGSKKEEAAKISEALLNLDIPYLLSTFKPLLSVDSSTIGRNEKSELTAKQQRQLIDQHLDLESATGLSSTNFLSDSEVQQQTEFSSPMASPSREATGELNNEEIKKEDEEPDESHSLASLFSSAIHSFTQRLVELSANQRWQTRHGAAIGISKVIAVRYKNLSSDMIDRCALRLLQVLVLDQFNDFVSGRTATAPVRETCAQAVGHLLNQTDDTRRSFLLQQLTKMMENKLEKDWHCRQSSLLVMKYFFVIAEASPIFRVCFDMVVQSLNDNVDDVVCCAVSTLSSLLSNSTIEDDRCEFVQKVMSNVWQLLKLEAGKEQLRSGLDTLAIDLMGIVDTWLRVDINASLNREELLVIFDMMDAAYQTRTHKIINLVSLALDRGEKVLETEDVFHILKMFYRIILFASPAENTLLLEQIYLTSLKLMQQYGASVVEDERLVQWIGIWTGCLLFDHRSPLIDVFEYGVDGPSSKKDDPMERMGSEEMRFLADREKDDVYVTRKILAAKLLAVLIQSLYETNIVRNEQPISLALQLLFIPYLRSNSLYQSLGAAIIVNEWSALFKAAINRGIKLDAPMTLITECDIYLRAPSKTYDEMTSNLTQLTQDCTEFIDYCGIRGVNRNNLMMDDNVSVEQISRTAYQLCLEYLQKNSDGRQVEALEGRYRVLADSMEFTKLAIKANSTRVFSLLSSALFYFSYVPEKMTPMIRPLVDCMEVEENETVAAEVYKGAVPLMIAFSWTRHPKPYTKVLTRAMDTFASCHNRIPRAEQWSSYDNSKRIISLVYKDSGEPKVSHSSRNAEYMLLVCTTFPPEQIPEFYSLFDLDDCADDGDDMILLARIELHSCLWARVGSRLSENSTRRILSLLSNPNPALRFAGAKAIVTFYCSELGDSMTRIYQPLMAMLSNIDNDHERRGAIESILRLSNLGNGLRGVVSLLAPPVFTRLSDKDPSIREAAGDAFRNLIPLLSLENVDETLPGLSEDLAKKRKEEAELIHVLSAPNQLPLVQKEEINGLSDEITLRHYQMEGVTWMRFLRKFGLNGILADDMGLGKTLQTLCVLAMAIDYDAKSNKKASLIICPQTIVDNWINEWHRFFPNRKRAVRSDKGWDKTTEIVVTSYEGLKHNSVVSRATWDYVVLDEGHIMRNSKTNIWKVANELNSVNRLILSGTPVQNSPADLWSLFTWLMPGYLGDERAFRANFLKSILKCRSPKATEKDMQDGADCVARLHRLILPFIMRRMKSEVLRELPEKHVQDYHCQLSTEQKAIYKFLVDRCSSQRETSIDGATITPLHALISLRKLVDHPCLVIDLLRTLKAPQNIMDMVMRNDAKSGKMAALGQLLNECGIGRAEEYSFNDANDDDVLNCNVLEMPHRALIFCQWKSSVQLVSDALTNGDFGSSVSHLILDGSIAPSDRQSIVDRFNSDHSIDVLVLTTHIGGVGLNLTGADVVIFIDHDWNPMKDLQAIDRAHRLGQKRKVNVYRLITQGTIEEKVMSLHKFKQNTADALIGADNRSLQSMATEELLNMFTLEGEDESSQSSGDGPSKKKKKKISVDTGEQWNISELWDESQYEEQFRVDSFLKDAAK